MIEISIVVPTFQRLEVLRASLPTILDQDLEKSRYEVIVVVDGSTDGTSAYLGAVEHPALHVLEQPNRGLATARNRGAGEARGRVVLFLDDDAHASPGLARAHLERHDRDGRVVLGAFPLLPAARRSFLTAGVERWADALAQRLSTSERPHFTDCSFANASLARSLWEATGGFHQGFRRFGNEDYDYAIRLLDAGKEFLFEPNALAWQDYRKTFATWCREWRDVGSADIRLWRRHPAIEPDLAFARLERLHPLRRAVLRRGLEGSRVAPAVVTPVRVLLGLADRLRLRGRGFDLAKWLPADLEYGRGVREALTEDPAVPLPSALASVLPGRLGEDDRG